MSALPVPTVLYLEDEQMNLQGIGLMLEMNGMTVRLCSTAAEALESFRRDGLPDVALIDIGLGPGMNGIDVARRVRAEHGNGLPIIFLSAEKRRAYIKDALAVGDDYILKGSPLDLVEVLLHKIGRALGMRDEGAYSAPPYQGTPGQWRLRSGLLSFDPNTPRAVVDERDIGLTPVELQILTHLVHRAGRVVPIQAYEMGGQQVRLSKETLKYHIHNIRRKLGDPSCIVTFRGYGYSFGAESLSGRTARRASGPTES